MMDFVAKGTTVLTRALYAQRAGTYSLAGNQPKVSAREVEFVGMVQHVRGDHPTAPTKVTVWVAPIDVSVADSLADLEVGVARCEKCGIIEVGPIPVGAIVGIVHKETA